uniref:Uncharacterized protein n=1 Tax=Candidatus Kentrum sp. TUN TaxID=2126343 RepID=A0A450ZN00_9GAMM|nr:MAG: hypothetical protein BECKTUN1418D_GA0071000_102724 [Candidatus Kentron sp. TUN]
MAASIFDTLKFVCRLGDSEILKQQVVAISEAFKRQAKAELVTKAFWRYA